MVRQVVAANAAIATITAIAAIAAVTNWQTVEVTIADFVAKYLSYSNQAKARVLYLNSLFFQEIITLLLNKITNCLYLLNINFELFELGLLLTSSDDFSGSGS